MIVRHGRILDVLEPGDQMMTDRGFKISFLLPHGWLSSTASPQATVGNNFEYFKQSCKLCVYKGLKT